MKSLLIYLCLFCFIAQAQQKIQIIRPDVPQVRFAVAKIESGLRSKGFEVGVSDKSVESKAVTILLGSLEHTAGLPSTALTNAEKLQAEGFIISQGINKGVKSYFVVGKDAAGMMYGGLELAEAIRHNGLNGISNVTQNPHMKRRGIKMNIPLDARTPSYTDASDAGQKNIAEMWSMDFWKEHIDSLASFRYNFISLWSLHPFPSMVKVPGYPDVALNDVHRSTIKWQEYYSTRGTGLDGPDVVDKFEVVKKITIEEKIRFWQEVMRYAKARNIDFYIVTWNTFTNSTKGKYGITDDLKNPVTIDYFRKSVKQLFITYPDLKGIGLTTGENMPGADFEAKENWSFETYGKGVMDVIAEQPNRKITFIHRQHETGALDIARKFAPLISNKNVNFVFSFKYAQAHVYSSTTQTYHPEFVKEIQSAGNLKTLWTLRNDDVYYFRWGAPDFVREFIKNIPTEPSEGFYFGSDQHIWGREFMDKDPKGSHQIELAKHWYHWMMWGRLGYNPNTPNKLFLENLKTRFPETDYENLFEAWQSASMIYPLTTGFHWGALDFQWYIEGCKSRPEPAQTPSGFHDVNRFINLPPHKGTDFISIPDYVTSKNSNSSPSGKSPFQVAELINKNADRALALADQLRTGKDYELFRILEDIKSMAYLGKYYAHKINGATHLALFRSNQNSESQQAMITELNQAANYWRYYSSTSSTHYANPLWTNRVGYVDWKDIYNYVLKEVTENGGEVVLEDMNAAAGGVVLEAENAQLNNADRVLKKPESPVDFVQARSGGAKVKWTFDAPEPGQYMLEFRYRTMIGSPVDVDVWVDQKQAAKASFWKSGSQVNWVIDRTKLELQKGTRDVEVALPENLQLDLINLIKVY
jgi:hypothetical protein